MEQTIYDFDGVVGNTYPLNWRLVKHMFPEVEESTYRIDHHLGNVFERPAVPFDETSHRRYQKLIRKLLDVEHIAEALPALRKIAQSKNQHIVTSNCEYAIGKVLKEAGARDLFGHILGYEADLSKEAKFQTIAEETGADLSETFYVTDTLGDILEAQKVNMKTIAVTFGYHDKELLTTGNPTYIVDTWEEAVSILA